VLVDSMRGRARARGRASASTCGHVPDLAPAARAAGPGRRADAPDH
jgi:hypothetical protein